MTRPRQITSPFRRIYADSLHAHGARAHQGHAMATLFLLNRDAEITRRPCADDRPLHLDAGAREADDGWALAIVPFAVTPRTPRRWALVVTPGTGVTVGATTVHTGVVELHDRDRVLLGEREMMFSTDALPEPVAAETPVTPCPVCCDAAGGDDGTGLFRCGRCGMRACRRCWDLAPRRECLTPGCHQPAAFDRPLWEPAPSDFVTWEGEETAG